VSALLEARRLHLRHPGADADAVRDVTLAVTRGEVLALVGPNGSGKSTILAALARSLRPRSGAVVFAGRDAFAMPRRAYARCVARLPQSPECPEGLTVEELVAAGRHSHRPVLGGMSADDRRAIRAALAAADVADLRRRRVETLSGGERRRAWLAMTLAQETPVLLLDEPTAGLDLRHQHDLLELLRALNRRRGVTVVLVVHELDLAARLADRVAVVHRGRLYAIGAPAACLTRETLHDVFQVETEVAVAGDRVRIHVVGPHGRPTRRL
jgi:iron complex transport system ATP-binding protein